MFTMTTLLFHLVVSALVLLWGTTATAAFSPAVAAVYCHHLHQQRFLSLSSNIMSLQMGKVVVELDKVTGLQDKDRLGTSDPYVKFELEKDNWIMDKDYGDRKSSRKGGETSPEYHETFVWDNVDSLNNMVLRVKVVDDDPMFDDKLGSCDFKLENLQLSDKPKEVVKVVDSNWFSQDAKIFLKISYQP